jgi:hypothetical protein
MTPLLTALSALALAPGTPVQAPAAVPAPTCLAGSYDGGAMEIAAGLELRPDGRFTYGLAYGALNEEATGRWEGDAKAVTLIGDPITPPRFSLVREGPGPQRAFRMALDLPEGMERQYFSVLLILAEGDPIEAQFTDDGIEIELGPKDRVVEVLLRLGVFDLISQPIPLAGGNGREARFRFAPNDLGKVAFDRTPLPRDGATLLLERHDRQLRFRPTEGGCAR